LSVILNLVFLFFEQLHIVMVYLLDPELKLLKFASVAALNLFHMRKHFLKEVFYMKFKLFLVFGLGISPFGTP
jgi:hypothetical protein